MVFSARDSGSSMRARLAQHLLDSEASEPLRAEVFLCAALAELDRLEQHGALTPELKLVRARAQAARSGMPSASAPRPAGAA